MARMYLLAALLLAAFPLCAAESSLAGDVLIEQLELKQAPMIDAARLSSG